VTLNEAVLALARAIHAAGPDGWRTATVSTRCSPHGQSGQAGYDNRGWLSVDRALQTDLATMVRNGEDSAVYELEVRSTGEVRLAYTHASGVGTSGAIVVRDKDFRLPGHPLPGSVPPPEHAGISDAPTDPAALARIRKLGDGRGEEDILATERELGFRLPEGLRALHCNGHTEIDRFLLATLEELVEWRGADGPRFGGWDDDEPLDLDPVPDVWPHGHVKRLCRNDWWLPFAVGENWDYLAVDLDPAENGRPGQVIWFDDNTEMGALVADSVADLLPPWTWSDDVLGNTELVLDGEPVPDPHIQKVNANQGGDIDLASFTVLPNLRDLRVNQAGRVQAAALPGLEALRVDAREFDLAPLAGHSTLWSLRLHGLQHAVDARVIATMTSLIRLDLAGVEVTNAEALQELPNLKVVTLSGEQWDRVALPDLAVAVLGRAGLVQRLAWLDRYDPLDRNRELHVFEAPNLEP
jgi:cell wall assembly regulator SMI1